MSAKVLFFSRDYQADFFVHLSSSKYESLLVTMTANEKRRIAKNGFKVTACFEDEFDDLPVADVPDDYLESSFLADRYQRTSSIFERRIILGKEISFWSNLLERFQPHLVINESVALEISEVLYLESKSRGIRYLSWMSLSIEDHFYWQTTAMHNSMDRRIFQVEAEPGSLEKAGQYLNKVKAGAGKPFYVNSLRGRYSLYSVARNIYWTFRCLLTEHSYASKAKNRAIFGDNLSFYTARLEDFMNSLFRSYDKLEKFKEFEIVFYPLHYEPEAVLFYMAEFFDNQAATIENFAKCLRHNQILVVKEHPQQTGILLNKNFRQLKKRIPNLVYLPAEYPTVHLIEKSKLVLTLGSTAGIEALILGKPVVTLGKIFYDAYEKVNTVQNYDDLKRFMRKCKNWNYPDETSLTTFLAQIIQYSKPGNPFPHANLYSKQNIRNIVAAIESELDQPRLT